MHGLINRSLECFISDTYGEPVWLGITKTANLGFDGFESMLQYDDALTYAVLDAAAEKLGKSSETLLDDLGTYLVSNPRLEALRRLLRFGGETFVDFLHSLDDLHDRAKLAVPELELPVLRLHGGDDNGAFLLTCKSPYAGFSNVIIGLLRAMADDYGALAFLQEGDREDEISIQIVEASFADGRDFSLSKKTDISA